jgi:hypothetical protein
MKTALALMVKINRKRSDMAGRHMNVTHIEHDLRLSRETQCAHEVKKNQVMLASQQSQLEQLLKSPVRPDHLFAELQHIQNLKEICQKSMQELETAKALTQQASDEHEEAKVGFLKLITKVQAYQSECQKIQTEENRRNEKKSELEMDDMFCKSGRTLF